MSRIMKVSLLLVVTVLAIMCGYVSAQSSTPAPTPNCIAAKSLQLNATLFSGTWYEVARNPAPSASNNYTCTQFSVTAYGTNNTNMNVTSTYSNVPNSWIMNTVANTSFLTNATNWIYGYNVTFQQGSNTMPTVTYKLLQTVYDQYAFICGFTNANDPSTQFGVVLSRIQVPQPVVLSGYQQSALTVFSGFASGPMATVPQSNTCMVSGAEKRAPIIAAIFAALYVAFKAFH